MSKLIFFDIDGTLTSSKKVGFVPESTRKAIQLLQENGHFVALATGRAHFRAMEFAQQIGISNLVCEGGNGIVINNEFIKYTPIDNELAKSICILADKEGFGVAVSTKDNRIRISPNDNFIRQTGDFSDFMEVVVDHSLDLSKLENIRRLFIALPPEKDNLLPSIENIGMMRYGSDFIIVEPDDKYQGIRDVVKILGKDEADVVVFGDGLNDRKMFKDAPMSIAMGNAIEELKEMATYVTTSSDDDGIYLACKHFGWI